MLVVKAITHTESWVQRHRNGFELRTARVNLKEDMDDETSDKGRHCRALRKNSDGVYDSNEREGRPKKELVHFHLL